MDACGIAILWLWWSTDTNTDTLSDSNYNTIRYVVGGRNEEITIKLKLKLSSAQHLWDAGTVKQIGKQKKKTHSKKSKSKGKQNKSYENGIYSQKT